MGFKQPVAGYPFQQLRQVVEWPLGDAKVLIGRVPQLCAAGIPVGQAVGKTNDICGRMERIDPSAAAFEAAGAPTFKIYRSCGLIWHDLTIGSDHESSCRLRYPAGFRILNYPL